MSIGNKGGKIPSITHPNEVFYRMVSSNIKTYVQAHIFQIYIVLYSGNI